MATKMPEERPRRRRDAEDEFVEEELTFAEESAVDPEGFAISEAEDTESGESRPRRKRKSEEAA